MEHTFSIQEAVRFGWHKTRAHSGLVFQVVLTLLALQVANAVVGQVLKNTPLGFMASIVLGVAMFVLGLGATRIALLLARGEHAHYRDLMPPTNLLWPYL